MSLPMEPGRPQPLPNAADVAWAELERLREEARELGLENVDGDPLIVLRSRVERAREAQTRG